MELDRHCRIRIGLQFQRSCNRQVQGDCVCMHYVSIPHNFEILSVDTCNTANKNRSNKVLFFCCYCSSTRCKLQQQFSSPSHGVVLLVITDNSENALNFLLIFMPCLSSRVEISQKFLCHPRGVRKQGGGVAGHPTHYRYLPHISCARACPSR